MSTCSWGERQHKRCGNHDHKSEGSNLAPKQESLASLIRSDIKHDAGDAIKSPHHIGFSPQETELNCPIFPEPTNFGCPKPNLSCQFRIFMATT
jgi:hypothetical protein